MTDHQFVVIGAGQAGLAAARLLQRAGADFLIVDAEWTVGGSWRHYYDSLELFSPVRYSSLPEFVMQGAPDGYPTRDDVVDYLQQYRDHFAFPVKLGTRILSVTREPDGFVLRPESGTPIRAQKLIVASGAFGTPNLPRIAGQGDYRGRIAHSSEYRNPDAYLGQRIIVVGAGNSAVQIAVELAGKADVTLAVRDKLRFLPQRVLGHDIHWWFDKLRLNGLNLFSDHGVPIVDDGRYKAALRANRPATRKMFRAFTADGVVWPDGTQERIDQVIFATGFRHAMDFLRPCGALDAKGQPLHRRGVSTTVPGLGYVGLSGQNGFASATLRGVGRDADYVIPRIAAM